MKCYLPSHSVRFPFLANVWVGAAGAGDDDVYDKDYEDDVDSLH